MASGILNKSNLFWIDAAGIGVCLLASVLAYMTLVGPFLQKRAVAMDQSQEMETREQKAADLEAALAAARHNLTSAQEQLQAGAIQLESAAHLNKRIADVTALLSRCDLHVDDVQTGCVSGGPYYDLVPITLVGRGTHQECVELLHGLCTQYPDMSVMRIEMVGTPAEQVQPGTFRLELFWYAAPSGPAQKKV